MEAVYSKRQYKKLRNDYKPESIRVVFVLESPPKSGKFFYDPDGEVTELLFKAMMELIKYDPANKRDGLKEFKRRGLIIVDSIYKSVNDMDEGPDRDAMIMSENEVFLKDLKVLIPDKRTPLILVKKNICLLLEGPLKEKGFIVANGGEVVPFPGFGQKVKFQKQIAKVLKNSGISI